jgi:SM-20-related protein
MLPQNDISPPALLRDCTSEFEPTVPAATQIFPVKPEQNLELNDRFEWSREKRCPHGTIRDVLGMPRISAMLDYLEGRQADFAPGYIQNRKTGERSLISLLGSPLFLKDLGPFRLQFESVIRAIAPIVLAQFGLSEAAVEPREFSFAWYGDGGYFKTHVDTVEQLEHVRVLSCIYYFAEKPRRFGGGELRLYGFPDPFRRSARPIVDVAPDTDKLVVFPSWLNHEVLPVHLSSKAWRDGRFTANCWIYRSPAGS